MVNNLERPDYEPIPTGRNLLTQSRSDLKSPNKNHNHHQSSTDFSYSSFGPRKERGNTNGLALVSPKAKLPTHPGTDGQNMDGVTTTALPIANVVEKNNVESSIAPVGATNGYLNDAFPLLERSI